jgi:pimeloyl-ACP methyl ester carboxylesterase
MNEVQLPQGTIRYRDSGSGEPIVLIHGFGVDGRVWERLVPLLDDAFRVVVPDLPLGAHRVPLRPDADLSPYGVARLVADFLEALELEGVTLVGNDTGGAICQLVATGHPERLARLVLTNCDAYEDFPPLMFRYLVWAAKAPGGLAALTASLRIKPLRRAPFVYGGLTKRRLEDELLEHWVEPAMTNRDVARDARKFLRSADKRYTLEAAERLRSFGMPTLLAWAPEDPFFKWKQAERLAAAIPNAQLERIEGSRAFVAQDQPERLAEVLRDFAREPVRA